MMTSRSLDAIPATSDRAAIANTTIKKTTTTMGTTEEEGRRRRWRLVHIQQSNTTMTTMGTEEEDGGMAHGIKIVGRAAGV